MEFKEYLLNKKIKLNQLKNNVKEDYIYPIDDELNDILVNAINNFFPANGSWTDSCFKHPNEELASNLRNNKLLAKKICIELNLPKVYYKKVLNFINSSDLFKQKVHEYEQMIVKWQINFIKNGGERWICDKKLGGDFCLMLPSCDIAFRRGVVDTLVAIGMDKEAIEEGLEKNSYMWRDYYIYKAFKAKYEPIINNFLILDNLEKNSKNKVEQMLDADLDHKKAWIKMRKYEYYCDHKKSVDLYGNVEPDMILSQEELIDLKKYLENENEKRLEYINQYENSNSKIKKLVRNK